MSKKHKHTARRKNAETTAEPPIEHGEVTEENPSGIVTVSEKHAEELGQLRGFGGPGAAGATVAGPAVHVATEGGAKPLPIPASQQVEVESESDDDDDKDKEKEE